MLNVMRIMARVRRRHWRLGLLLMVRSGLVLGYAIRHSGVSSACGRIVRQQTRRVGGRWRWQ